MIADAVDEAALTQASIVGAAPSAETEVVAETVTPCRPAGPSVVTTQTVEADRLIPSRKAVRRASGSVIASSCRARQV